MLFGEYRAPDIQDENVLKILCIVLSTELTVLYCPVKKIVFIFRVRCFYHSNKKVALRSNKSDLLGFSEAGPRSYYTFENLGRWRED